MYFLVRIRSWKQLLENIRSNELKIENSKDYKLVEKNIVDRLTLTEKLHEFITDELTAAWKKVDSKIEVTPELEQFLTDLATSEKEIKETYDIITHSTRFTKNGIIDVEKINLLESQQDLSRKTRWEAKQSARGSLEIKSIVKNIKNYAATIKASKEPNKLQTARLAIASDQLLHKIAQEMDVQKRGIIQNLKTLEKYCNIKQEKRELRRLIRYCKKIKKTVHITKIALIILTSLVSTVIATGQTNQQELDQLSKQSSQMLTSVNGLIKKRNNLIDQKNDLVIKFRNLSENEKKDQTVILPIYTEIKRLNPLIDEIDAQIALERNKYEKTADTNFIHAQKLSICISILHQCYITKTFFI